MPPGFVFTINVIYLMKYGRNTTEGLTNMLTRYPGENATDISNQATYFKNIHGYPSGGIPGVPQL